MKEVEQSEIIVLSFLDFFVSIGNVFFKSYALSKIYGWFLVPEGLPEISFAAIFGVLILLQLLNSKERAEIYQAKEGLKSSLSTTVKCLFFLLFGFVVKIIL